jgi:hypothetical protein
MVVLRLTPAVEVRPELNEFWLEESRSRHAQQILGMVDEPVKLVVGRRSVV